MQRLGSAINEAITTSDEVDAALSDVRQMGIDVFLVLEATICVRQRDAGSIEEPDDEAARIDAADSAALEISAEDRQFLKRLRISLDVEDEDGD